MFLWIMALEPSLSGPFKLIKASVPTHGNIGVIQDQPRLLIASFEFNGMIAPVIIDTGATISIVPEHGTIMAKLQPKPKQANVSLSMADEGIVHVNQQVSFNIRPATTQIKPIKVSMFVANNTKTVLGHAALLGLDVLKQFDLNIKFNNNQVRMYHRDTVVGSETTTNKEYQASITVNSRFESLKLGDELNVILSRFSSVFSDVSVEPIKGEPMRFITTHSRPIHAPLRHYNKDEIIQMKAHVEGLLKQGIIEPSDSGYAAQSRIIPKKNGSGRLVINYIPLNASTIRNSYAGPHVHDIFGVIQGKQFFSVMDCSQGFYQIQVDPRDKHKTAFSTPLGNFQFIRAPFGARNSGAKFQSEMNRVLQDGLYTRCVVYVDDILVFGKDIHEHNRNLAWVLERCLLYNVKLKLEKCKFARKQVNYLGFVISGESIQPQPSKVDAIVEAPSPTDKTMLRSILGKLNFYARFIPNYSKLAEPLRVLQQKNVDFQWKDEHQASLVALKSALKSATKLKLCASHEEKYIELHISGDSIEALLLDKQDQLIMRTSRFLSTNQVNYSFIEKQMMALVEAIDKFKVYLQPEAYIIRTPDNTLQRALSKVNRAERIDRILLDMPEGHDSFKFEIKTSIMHPSNAKSRDHIAQEIYYIDGACRRNGKSNCKASWAVCAEFDQELQASGYVSDLPSNQSAEITAAIKACDIAKSRDQSEITIVTDSNYVHSAVTNWIDKWLTNDWIDHKKKPVVHVELFKRLLDAKRDLKIEWIKVKGHSGHPGNTRADQLATSLLDASTKHVCAAMQTTDLQAECQEIDELKQAIEDGKHPDLIIQNDTVYFVDTKQPEGDQLRVFVPSNARPWLLRLAHDSQCTGGHQGIKKTHRKLHNFYWPRMYKDVESYIKSCDVCQRFKQPVGRPPGYLHSIPVSEIFEHLHLDIMGPFTTTPRGNQYIYTATDAMSKWAYTRAAGRIRSSDLIKFLEECILSIHGNPQVIITDNGSQLTSDEWKSFIDKHNIKQCTTTAYHPQSNGIDERLNGTITRILRAYVDELQSDWDHQLKWATHLYNNTVHESTGYSPYQILHGYDPRSPLRVRLPLQEAESKDIDGLRKLIRSQARDANAEAQTRQRKYYNAHRREVEYFVGQQILVRNHTAAHGLKMKLHPKWDGPVYVISINNDDSDSPKAITYLDPDRLCIKTVAVQDVKPYIRRSSDLVDSTNQTLEPGQKGGHDASVNDDDALLTSNWFYATRDGSQQNESVTNRNSFIEAFSNNSQNNESMRRSCLKDSTQITSFDAELASSDGRKTSTPRRIMINDEPSIHIIDNDAQTRRLRPRDPSKQPQYTAPIPQVDDSISDPTFYPQSTNAKQLYSNVAQRANNAKQKSISQPNRQLDEIPSLLIRPHTQPIASSSSQALTSRPECSSSRINNEAPKRISPFVRSIRQQSKIPRLSNTSSCARKQQQVIEPPDVDHQHASSYDTANESSD